MCSKAPTTLSRRVVKKPTTLSLIHMAASWILVLIVSQCLMISPGSVQFRNHDLSRSNAHLTLSTIHSHACRTPATTLSQAAFVHFLTLSQLAQIRSARP